jgi:hypothetical protein
VRGSSGRFAVDGVRVPLLGSYGVFEPQVLRDIPRAMTTPPNGPYDDAFERDGS